jgi:hypothetical protein
VGSRTRGLSRGLLPKALGVPCGVPPLPTLPEMLRMPCRTCAHVLGGQGCVCV